MDLSWKVGGVHSGRPLITQVSHLRPILLFPLGLLLLPRQPHVLLVLARDSGVEPLEERLLRRRVAAFDVLAQREREPLVPLADLMLDLSPSFISSMPTSLRQPMRP